MQYRNLELESIPNGIKNSLYHIVLDNSKSPSFHFSPHFSVTTRIFLDSFWIFVGSYKDLFQMMIEIPLAFLLTLGFILRLRNLVIFPDIFKYFFIKWALSSVTVGSALCARVWSNREWELCGRWTHCFDWRAHCLHLSTPLLCA